MHQEIAEMLPAPAMVASVAPSPRANIYDPSQLILSFHREVKIAEEAEEVKVHLPAATQTLRGATPGMRAVLRSLVADGARQDELADLLLSLDGQVSLAGLYYRIEQWKAWKVLRYTLADRERRLLTIEPMSPKFQLKAGPIEPDAGYALSRFAFCRRLRNQIVLESPLCHARVLLEGDAGAALIGALALPRSARELSSHAGLPEDIALTAVSLLAQLSLAVPANEDGTTQEDHDDTLQQWNFHDLLFHSRSRVGRHDYPFGANYRFFGKIPSQPAVKPQMSGDVVGLYRPDLDALMQHDLPFTHVLETRRSVRDYADPPISLQQIGEFLYRTARVRYLIEPFSSPGMIYQASSRPYPGGGAGYELELYLTVNTCDGLPSGIYHYDPLEHQLCRLAPRNAHVEALLDGASISAARLCVPQVLITFAARFQRMGWKYDGMAYAATLKNVGVMYQTMYLVATAMGIAPCGLGSGNSDLLAQAAGLDYLKESSVGEFMLGSRAS